MSKTIWKPLRSEASIRHLILHPAQASNPEEIHASLEEVYKKVVPRYDAISYTWGSDLNQKSIFINGQELAIRENLWVFLRRLRASEDRRLWVDALCINQNDLIEKGQQVGIIGDIFRKADRVLGWIGEHSDGSRDILRDCREALQKRYGMRPRIEDLVGGDSHEEKLQAWHAFLSRPWFGRTWIVQEVVMAKGVLIHCGDDVVNWEELPHVDYRFDDDKRTLVTELEILAQRLARLASRRRFYQASIKESRFSMDDMCSDGHIQDIVREFKAFKCTDTRDKIFALSALETPSGAWIKIRPDYMLTVEETLVSVFRQKQPDLELHSIMSSGNSFYRILARFVWQVAEALELAEKGFVYVADVLQEGIREGDKDIVWKGTAREIRAGKVDGKTDEELT